MMKMIENEILLGDRIDHKKMKEMAKIDHSMSHSHSNSVSFILGIMYLHIGRGLYINSNVFNMTLWTSGVIIFIFMVVIAFLGYCLTWGQISFWGSTVI